MSERASAAAPPDRPLVEIRGPWLLNKGDALMLRAVVEALEGRLRARRRGRARAAPPAAKGGRGAPRLGGRRGRAAVPRLDDAHPARRGAARRGRAEAARRGAPGAAAARRTLCQGPDRRLGLRLRRPVGPRADAAARGLLRHAEAPRRAPRHGAPGAGAVRAARDPRRRGGAPGALRAGLRARRRLARASAVARPAPGRGEARARRLAPPPSASAAAQATGPRGPAWCPTPA